MNLQESPPDHNFAGRRKDTVEGNVENDRTAGRSALYRPSTACGDDGVQAGLPMSESSLGDSQCRIAIRRIGCASVLGSGGFSSSVQQRSARSGDEDHGARRTYENYAGSAWCVDTPGMGGGGEHPHCRPRAGLQCQSHVISLVHGRRVFSVSVGLGGTRMWVAGWRQPP